MNLLSELYVPISTTPPVYCDNIGTTYLCQNPVFIDFHFVRDQVHKNRINIVHVHSADQLAASFQRNLIKLGVVDTYPNLRGHKGTISAVA